MTAADLMGYAAIVSGWATLVCWLGAVDLTNPPDVRETVARMGVVFLLLAALSAFTALTVASRG